MTLQKSHDLLPMPPNDAHQASAKSYIPETTWNDSCTNSEWSLVTGLTNAESNCNNSQVLSDGGVVATGGGGGKSSCTSGSGVDIISCTGGYPKPSWQTGAGVPNDGSVIFRTCRSLPATDSTTISM